MYGTGKNSKSSINITAKGRMPNGNSGATHEGETSGVGQIQSAVLNERPLRSNTRNIGPEGTPSEIGATRLPVITTADRKTGRIA